MKKIFVIVIVALFILTGCSKSVETYETRICHSESNLGPNLIQNASITLFYEDEEVVKEVIEDKYQGEGATYIFEHFEDDVDFLYDAYIGKGVSINYMEIEDGFIREMIGDYSVLSKNAQIYFGLIDNVDDYINLETYTTTLEDLGYICE